MRLRDLFKRVADLEAGGGGAGGGFPLEAITVDPIDQVVADGDTPVLAEVELEPGRPYIVSASIGTIPSPAPVGQTRGFGLYSDDDVTNVAPTNVSNELPWSGKPVIGNAEAYGWIDVNQTDPDASDVSAAVLCFAAEGATVQLYAFNATGDGAWHITDAKLVAQPLGA